MTTYSQRCQSCDHLFDDVRSMLDYDRDPRCPECGGKTRQDFSHGRSVPLIFKGDGFHANRPRTVVTEPGAILESGEVVRKREVDLRPGQRSC